MTIPNFVYDADRIEAISNRFELRKPNKLAFDAAIAALAGDVNPAKPVVLSMATGVGKTYVMAAIVEYLRELDITDAIIVTPSKIVQTKTVANFQQGSHKYIDGAFVPPSVITPENYDEFRGQPQKFSMFALNTDPMQLFVLNVQQLTTNATKFPSEREISGNLKKYLQGKNDLVVLADEHHLYSSRANAFHQAIMDLGAAAVIGLTASSEPGDDVRYRYTLREAINDRYVKRPVIAFRRNGYGEHKEEQQLRDAIALLNVKQSAFDTYLAANPGIRTAVPVLFVQCADVDHATQTTALLRTPEYFGKHEAVLQVDNKHDDDATLDRLTNIDSAGSPVRAVVSVNKLKEGWDVKNVAVMVTLRAMASEVLTQQTLGRGLRLPFGKITGIDHVDQLDVLAHESFTKMLKNEDVLREFGLEAIRTEPKSETELKSSALLGRDVTRVDERKDRTSQSDQVTDDDAENREPSIALPTAGGETTARVIDGGIGVIELGDDDVIAPPPAPVQMIVKMNEKLDGATFDFPSTIIKPVERKFDLVASISYGMIDDAAAKVSGASSVLQRQELNFKSKKLRALATEDVEVDSIHIDVTEAKAELISQVVALRTLDATRSNHEFVKKTLVPRFVAHAPVTNWSVHSLKTSAVRLRELVETAARKHRRNLGEEVIINPITLPIANSYPLKPGETILDLLDASATSREFAKFRHYGTWRRGLFTAASFDSFSAEYKLAAMLDRSPSIVWWKRLYPSDRASIAYTATDNYNPDFVALDTAGVHWIIEGKGEDKKTDTIVAAKRRAAEAVIPRMLTDVTFGEQDWGYAIAFESDVADADSWDGLISSVNPVKTERY